MPDIPILKEMLQDSATVPLEQNIYGKKMVRLCEPKKDDHIGYEVEIHGMPNEENCVVIKTDDFTPPSKFFRGTKGERKRADFVIIANTNDVKVIICIELKATKKTSSSVEVIQQLKGAQCVIEYCQRIGKQFWNNANFLADYEYRFVTVRDISIPKKTSKTKKDPTALHNTPANMLKIDSPNKLYLKQLISGSC
ncbi:MAG: hypothetical protein PHI11_04325 [Gallionella sp.]|nr:hypothetical protein [Gallionella sp.]